MDSLKNLPSQGQIVLQSRDLAADIAFFNTVGFRLDQIYPADDPAVAILSGHGLSLRLDRLAAAGPAVLLLLTDSPEMFGGPHPQKAPNGTEIRFGAKSLSSNPPETRHQFEVRHLQDSNAWVIGRAGMLYRDLVPGRLGGSMIATHIRIPLGGPVPDLVHYHTIGFQLIYCYKGWVRLVYEDQGPAFILNAGDAVIQPPEIRHRVLESSDNLEVVEIGVPADHMTSIDHALELPTPHFLPDRLFQGQRFCHFKRANADLLPFRIPGFKCFETGIAEATRGRASVQIAIAVHVAHKPIRLLHTCDIFFTFLLQGQVKLAAEGHGEHALQAGDAFVIPPGMKYQFWEWSPDLEMLEVTLPGAFFTQFFG